MSGMEHRSFSDEGIDYTISTMSSARRFSINERLIVRVISGKGDERRQHVSSDVALEMERRVKMQGWRRG